MFKKWAYGNLFIISVLILMQILSLLLGDPKIHFEIPTFTILGANIMFFFLNGDEIREFIQKKLKEHNGDEEN